MIVPCNHRWQWRMLILAAASACGEAPEPIVTPQVENLEGREQHWIDFLARYLRVDTSNPPGREARAFPLLSEALASIGLHAETSTFAEERGYLWARLHAERPD